MITPQAYIESALQQLRQPPDLPHPKTDDELITAIFRLLTSKKFRKYALTDAYAAHIKHTIGENVRAKQPINLTFLGSSYKLWRLAEAPESDWAELFACMYFTRWVAPICAIYQPGVWFDFFLDDVIVARINNIPEASVAAYRGSRQRILDFLKAYQPDNLRMTLTGVGGLFPSRAVYETQLEESIAKLAAELPGGLPELTDAQRATTTLNVKATPEQSADPKWREKVELVHSAYLRVKDGTGYSTTPGKIRVFTQPFASGTCIAVGSTKDTIAKFWVGVGTLKPHAGSFRQIIVSPKQFEAARFHEADIAIDGLSGKNFSRIRVLDAETATTAASATGPQAT